MSFLKNFLISIGALLVAWAVWLIAHAAISNDYLLPSFFETMGRCFRLLGEGEFWRAFLGTILRTLLAFALSLVLGAGLAFVASLHSFVRSFLAPLVSILRTVPTMAVILLLLFWTTPKMAPVIVALLVLMPAFYAATLAAVDEVRGNFGIFTRAYRVPLSKKIFKMYLPLAAPALLSQAGAIFAMGLKITVSGEVLANTFQSIGGLMQEAKMFLEMPTLMALTLLSVLVGFVFEGLGALVYRYFRKVTFQ